MTGDTLGMVAMETIILSLSPNSTNQVAVYVIEDLWGRTALGDVHDHNSRLEKELMEFTIDANSQNIIVYELHKQHNCSTHSKRRLKVYSKRIVGNCG